MTQSTAQADFDRITEMETPMSARERCELMRRFTQSSYIVFAADRSMPIRRDDILPKPWADWRPGAVFRGKAQKGEWYPFQLAIYAKQAAEHVSLEFSDLKGPGRSAVKAGDVRCINLGGVDWAGRPMTRDMSVARGKVQALWIGVQVPATAAAGEYRGTATVRAAGGPAVDMTIVLDVAGPAVKDCGDDDIERLSRLRWLDSTIAHDNRPTVPYRPLKVRGRTIACLGRDMALDAMGLPAGIVSHFTASVTRIERPGRQILAGPIELAVETARGVVVWKGRGPKIARLGTGVVQWQAKAAGGDLTLAVRGRMEFDGTLQYRLTLRALRDTAVKDIRLHTPFAADVAKYLMGLGCKGGRRPSSLRWRWSRQKHQDAVWIGDVNAGLRCKFYGDDYVRPVINAHYKYGKLNVPDCWSNGDRGGIRMDEQGGCVVLAAFTGPRALAAGQELTFCFDLQITPSRPIDTDAHWRQRYFHAVKPVEEVRQSGANIINIHHANDLNPFINYPLFPEPVARLREYIGQAHKASLAAKVYYTMRELTTHPPELWALRSLGSEVLLDGDGLGFWVKDKSQMDPWCVKHLRSGYRPAWRHEFTEGAYKGQSDASILTASLSRWCNFYLQGLDWLCRTAAIDGLYIDDVCYDRTVMQRVRRILDRRRPGSLIDMHSWNHMDQQYGAAGDINSALLYMELMPYLDSLWYGEAFDYNEGPDFWLTELAGIPYGLMGEMLQNGGNPWRGMVFGMSQRLPWSGDPRGIWKLWDDFGLAGSEMIGYWDPACPVCTHNDDVLATVYRRRGRTLVCLASWAAQPVTVAFDIDWPALGIKPAAATIDLPAIAGLQEAGTLRPDDPVTVDPAKGCMLVIR